MPSTTGSNFGPTSPFDGNAQPTITLPPPISTSGSSRSRTSIQLPPPPSVRATSTLPSRYSSFLSSVRSSRNSSPERCLNQGTIELGEAGVEKHQFYKHHHKSTASVTKLASWFEGTSDPVRVGLVQSPRKEQSELDTGIEQASTMFSSMSDDVDTFTRRPSEAQGAASSTGRSRFSFFRKPPVSQLSLATNTNDELSRLDIREVLFTAEQPEELTPTSFKNLQSRAEGALQRFQTAHIEQQNLLKSVMAAKEAQADDLEAAETRNQHLKLQLSEMAERAAEQESIMASLKAELNAVRQQAASEAPPAHGGIRKVSQISTERYRHKRTSDVSSSEGSESGSDIISVFSDPMSADESPGTSVSGSPVIKHAIMYQARIGQPTEVPTVPECERCHGLRPNEAWDVVSIMKLESKALKHRIAELEGAHDDALAFLKSMNIV